jgi:hypothetical protein
MSNLHAINRTAHLCAVTLLGMHLTLGAATLTNRYNFNEVSGTTAADLVGGQNATLMNNAMFDGAGSAVISSFGMSSTNPAGDYIKLPNNIVSNRTAITVETWYTPTQNDAAFGDWIRIWDFWNPSSHFFFRTGNNVYGGVAGYIAHAPGEDTLFGPEVTDLVENHVAFTSDPATGIARIYINGVMVASRTGWTHTPAGMGSTTNNWLGRSKFPDFYLQAAFNEFRIYAGSLNPFEVAASYQSGANAPSVNFGTVTNISLQLPSSLLLGNSQNAQVTGKASLLNAAVAMTGEPGLTYQSDNTGVLTVDSAGKVVAAGLGSATITATYVLNSVTNKDSRLISVISVPARLAHRYSFNNDFSATAVDSVGAANGTFLNGSYQSGGSAVLDGFAGNYVSLPSGLVSTNSITNNAVTFESWVTFPGTNANFVNLFAFGNTVGSDGGDYVFFSPHTGFSDYRLVVSDTQPGWNGGEQWAIGPGNLDNRTNVQVVGVVNFGRDLLALYVNGVRVGQNTAFTRSLSDIINNFSYLGRSLYPNDPYLNAQIDEFRMYDGALSAQQIAANYQTAGPNVTNANPGTLVNLTLSAPTNLIAGYQSSTVQVIANWQNATNVNLAGDLDLSLSSSDTNVATISVAGVITALSPGTATISANYQGNTDSKLLTVVAPASVTQAYWDCDQGVAGGPISTNPVPDLSGNGNTMFGFDATFGPSYSALGDTPSGLGLSLAYLVTTNGGQDGFTAGAPINLWAPLRWTIEVSARLSNTAGYLTIIGKDGGNVASDFYLQRNDGSGVWRLDFSTVGGERITIDSSVVPQAGLWIGLAAVSDGTNVTLWADQVDGNGYLPVGSAAFAVPGVPGNALANANGANWTFGRGWFNGGFGDYVSGNLDNIRFSAAALSSSQFLAVSAPAPSLSFSVSGGNLNLLWPTNASAYVPKSSAVVGTGASWTTVPGTPTVSGPNYLLSVPMTNAARFFRLEK